MSNIVGPEALEKLNLLLDIAIDEERYADVKKWVTILNEAGDAISDPETPGDLECAARDAISVRLTHDLAHETLVLEGDGNLAGWARLACVKRLRAHLQSRRDEMPGGLNRLAEYLIGRLVQPPVEFLPLDGLIMMDPPIRTEYEIRKTLNLLHLNEVGACYKHDLSVGFALQAIAQINEASRYEAGGPRAGWNIYELLALLNEGMGFAHAHRHKEALAALEEVIGAFEEWDDQHYVADPGDPYLSGRLPVNDSDDLIRLWRIYAYAPALVHRAEVLSDLNRATEQLPTLERLDNVDSDYSQKRGTLLASLARLDGNLWNDTTDPAIEGISDIEEWLAEEGILDGRVSFTQKCHQVLLRYRLECLRRGCQKHNADGTGLVAFPAQDARALYDQFSAFEQRSQPLGDSEQKDAALLWIDFYETLVGLGKQFAESDFLLQQDIEKLARTATDFFTSSRWFPDQDARGRLLAVMERLNPDTAYADLAEAEARVLNHLVSDDESPAWKTTKAVRRLQKLDKACAKPILAAAFRLPVANEGEHVVNNARDVFCDPACPELEEHGHEGCAHSAGEPWTSCRAHTYQAVLEANKASFVDQLIYRTKQPVPNSYCLTVLRRWQSFTPALSTGTRNSSRGGGYFVYKTDPNGYVEEGIVVDPGFDFVENFLREGFSIRDISAVVMTHAHVDHTADFQPLITLVAEYNKSRFVDHGLPPKPEKRLLALMSDGCYDKYQEAIEDSRLLFKDVVVMNRGLDEDGIKGYRDWRDHLCQLTWFRVRPVLALHNDFTSGDSVGVVICDSAGSPLVGFTGDTTWWPALGSQFDGVPTLCANLGGIVPVGKHGAAIARDLLESGRVNGIVSDENHLYWPGFSLLGASLSASTQLVVMAELCEELKGGLRTDLASQLNLSPPRSGLRFLPEDVGLTVELSSHPRVHCFACDRTVVPEKMTTVSFGRDESTYYVCEACRSYREQAVQEGVSEYHENGWPLEIDRLG